MGNPNQLAEPLCIKPLDPKALCEIHFNDRRYTSLISPLERPVAITLSTSGFEAWFHASYEDMRAMRDWLSSAMAAMEAADSKHELRA